MKRFASGEERVVKHRTPRTYKEDALFYCPYSKDAKCSKVFKTLAAVRSRVKREHRSLNTEGVFGTQKALV